MWGIMVDDAHATIDQTKVQLGKNNRFLLDAKTESIGTGSMVGTTASLGTFNDTTATFFDDDVVAQEDVLEIFSGIQQGVYWIYSVPSQTQLRIYNEWDDAAYEDYIDESDISYRIYNGECATFAICNNCAEPTGEPDDSFNFIVRNSVVNAGYNNKVRGISSEAYEDDNDIAPNTEISNNLVVGVGERLYMGVNLSFGYIRVHDNVIQMSLLNLQDDIHGVQNFGLHIDSEWFDPIAEGETSVWIENNQISGGNGARQWAMHIDGNDYGEPDAFVAHVANNIASCGNQGGQDCKALKVDFVDATIEDNDFFAGPLADGVRSKLTAANFEDSRIFSRRNIYRTDDNPRLGLNWGWKIEADEDYMMLESEDDQVLVGATGNFTYPDCPEDDDEPGKCTRARIYGIKIDGDDEDDEPAWLTMRRGRVVVGDSEGGMVHGIFGDSDRSEISTHIALHDTEVIVGDSGGHGCFVDDDDYDWIDGCENHGIRVENAKLELYNSTVLGGSGADTFGVSQACDNCSEENEPVTIKNSTVAAGIASNSAYALFQQSRSLMHVNNSLVFASAAGNRSIGWFFEGSDNGDCQNGNLQTELLGNTIAATGSDPDSSFGMFMDYCDENGNFVIHGNSIAAGTAYYDGDNDDYLSAAEINNCEFGGCASAGGNKVGSSSVSPY